MSASARDEGLNPDDVAQSFAPFVRQRPRPHLLILGSMPGRISLAQSQYYAHQRNAFWPIMAGLAGFSPLLNYQNRLAALGRAKVALWDVLKHCERTGSLDQNIKNETPNDIAGFLAQQTSICAVFLNGGKAAVSFRRHILNFLPRDLAIYDLPSTSPAHARQREEEKFQLWRAAWLKVQK